MKDLKEKFAQKMLDEKLDFLPIEESLQLLESGVELETHFKYVICREEIDEDKLENGEPRTWLNAYLKIYDSVEIGDEYDYYNEFTLGICPAPTYIDLIK
jgi:hypothetical protein